MTRIILRNDITSNWESVNPILSRGEVGIDTTTKQFKIGDGLTSWSQLPYAGKDSELDKYLTGSSSENTTTISSNGKALSLDAPMIAVGDNLVNEINGENTQLYLKQGDVEAGDNITVDKTATGIRITSTGGSGTPTDSYTKDEVNSLLDNKQDSFTTTAPLSLASMSYSVDSVNIYGDNFAVKQNMNFLSYRSDGTLTAFTPLTSDYQLNNNLSLFAVASPDVIKNNLNRARAYNQVGTMTFGNLGSDGKFTPILSTGYIRKVASSSASMGYGIAVPINPGEPTYSYNETSPGNCAITVKGSSMLSKLLSETPTVTNAVSQVQFLRGANDTLTIKYSHVNMNTGAQLATTSLNVPTVQYDDFQPNCIVFYLHGTYGIDKQVPINQLGIFAEDGTQVWSVGSTTSSNNLHLNIGNGLDVVDGKLVATAQIPSNVVTTDNLVANLPIGSDMQEGIVQVDGTTIISNDGVISAIIPDSPANMVTTNTTQDISGSKSFMQDVTLQTAASIVKSGMMCQFLKHGGNTVLMSQNSPEGSSVTLGNNSMGQLDLTSGGGKINSNDVLTTANAFKQVSLTQAEYDGLETKDSSTLYLITEG